MVTKQWYAAQENLYNSLKINKLHDLAVWVLKQFDM